MLARSVAVRAGRLRVAVRGLGMEAAFVRAALAVMLRRFAMMVRRRLMMERRRAMVMCGESAHAPRFSRLARIPLMGIPALMSCPAAFTGDLALTLWIH